MCVSVREREGEEERERHYDSAVVQRLSHFSYSLLSVFDAGIKKGPSHTDIIKEQRDCPSSWMKGMTRGRRGCQPICPQKDTTWQITFLFCSAALKFGWLTGPLCQGRLI